MPNTHAPTVTTPARRLARQHNCDERLISGYIYEVDLESGHIGPLVATYAAAQVGPDDADYGKCAFLRISHGRISERTAQRFLDAKGKGW